MRLAIILILTFVVFISTNSYAVNMQYLKYSPVASFTTEDFNMLQTTGKKALEENKDGQLSEWKNPETGHSGSITPLNSKTIDGMHCRKVRFLNRTENISGQAIYTFCRVDNKWKILK